MICPHCNGKPGELNLPSCTRCNSTGTVPDFGVWESPAFVHPTNDNAYNDEKDICARLSIDELAQRVENLEALSAELRRRAMIAHATKCSKIQMQGVISFREHQTEKKTPKTKTEKKSSLESNLEKMAKTFLSIPGMTEELAMEQARKLMGIDK